MAWVKIKINENIIEVPETVYETMFKDNKDFKLIPEPKPEIKEEKEIVKDELLNDRPNESKHTNKVSKKAV